MPLPLLAAAGAGLALNAAGGVLANQSAGRARRANAQNAIDEQKRRLFALYGWKNISSNQAEDTRFMTERWGIDPNKLGGSFQQGATGGLADITRMVRERNAGGMRTLNNDAATNLAALRASRAGITGQYNADTQMLAGRTGEMERTAQQYGIGGEAVINQTFDRALGANYADIDADLTNRGLSNTTIRSQQRSYASGENAYRRASALDELRRARTGMMLDTQRYGTSVAADRAAGGTELDTRFALTENSQMLDAARQRIALWSDNLARLTNARSNEVNVPLQVLTGGPGIPQVTNSGDALSNVLSEAGGSLIYSATRGNQQPTPAPRQQGGTGNDLPDWQHPG